MSKVLAQRVQGDASTTVQQAAFEQVLSRPQRAQFLFSLILLRLRCMPVNAAYCSVM